MEVENFSVLVDSTAAMARDLEALKNQHHSMLAEYKVESVEAGVLASEEPLPSDSEWDPEFEEAVRKEKEELVNESMKKLEAGMNEAKVMLMLGNQVNFLNSDRQKLKAQVKRLCSENNWLRQELTKHQYILQETEILLSKMKEEKEQIEFLLDQEKKDKSIREHIPAMDIDALSGTFDVRCGEFSADRVSLLSSQEAADYEVPEKIKTLHHLALQYVNQGKHDVAVPLCKKAVKELELKKGRDNPDLAAMLNVLAVIYREQGKLKDATKILQETLDIRERVFGHQHPAVASTLNNLSVLYGKCGDFRAAEPFCKQALEIRQKLLGNSHPDVAKQFTNLAILCSHLGKYDEVEYYYQRALEIYQTEFGSDDPNVTKTMTNLANCYLKQGKYKAAETFFKKVLTTVQIGDISQSGSKDASAWVIRSPTQGKEESHSGKGAWHKVGSSQSPTVTSTLKNLSIIYREQGKVDTANELDELTQRDMNQVQRERVNELLADTDTEPSPSSKSATSLTSELQPGLQLKRVPTKQSLSKGVRRLFGLMGTDQTDRDGRGTGK